MNNPNQIARQLTEAELPGIVSDHFNEVFDHFHDAWNQLSGAYKILQQYDGQALGPYQTPRGFGGIDCTEPKDPYIEGFKLVAANLLNILPDIGDWKEKIGFKVPGSPDPGIPIWSGMDVRNYSGLIPSEAGVPMQIVPLDPRLMLPEAGQGYRFMYSTTDLNGNPAVCTGEILLPKGQPPESGWKIIDYAHGTVGVGDDVTPSATNRYDAPYMNDFLRDGYAVVATDYVGLGTPGTQAYLAGKSEGLNVDDAVLAASKISCLHLGNDFVINGRSQGGGAALAAANYVDDKIQGTNLHFRGTIANAPAPGAAGLIPVVGTPLFSIAAQISPITAAHGLYMLDSVRQYHGDGFDLDHYLTPYGKEVLDNVQTTGIDQLTDQAKTIHYGKMFIKSPLLIPELYQAAHVEDLPTDNIKGPTLVVQGFLDGQVFAPFTMGLNLKTALHGQTNIHYEYFPLQTHSNIQLPRTRGFNVQNEYLQYLMGDDSVISH